MIYIYLHIYGRRICFVVVFVLFQFIFIRFVSSEWRTDISIDRLLRWQQIIRSSPVITAVFRYSFVTKFCCSFTQKIFLLVWSFSFCAKNTNSNNHNRQAGKQANTKSSSTFKPNRIENSKYLAYPILYLAENIGVRASISQRAKQSAR